MDVSRSIAGPLFQKNRGVQLTTKDGNFGIDTIDAPESVGTGDEFPLSFRAFNGFIVSPNDRDNCANDANPCSTGPFVDAPICYVVDIETEWGQTFSTGPDCLPGTQIGVNERNWSTNLSAPDVGGSFRISVTLRHPGTGESRSTSISIDVGSQSQCSNDGECGPDEVCNEFGRCVSSAECQTDADCPDGVCRSGACVSPDPGGGNSFLDRTQTLLALAIVFVIVLQASG